MKQIHIKGGTIFQILRFLYRIAKRWGSGGMPTLPSRQASGFVKNLGSFWKQALKRLVS